MFDAAWLFACLVVILTATLQAISGFGFTLIATILLITVLDIKTVVALTMSISVVLLAIIAYRCRRDIIWPLLKNLYQGALFGLPLGIYVFITTDTYYLKIAACCVVILFSLTLTIKNARHKGDAEVISEPNGAGRQSKDSLLQRLAGLVAGFLCGSMGMGGSIIVLFLNQQAYPKANFRATASSFFIANGIISVLSYAASGAVSPRTFLMSLSLLPFALLGNLVGFRIFPLVSQALFQRGVPVLVMLTALYSLINSLKGYR